MAASIASTIELNAVIAPLTHTRLDMILECLLYSALSNRNSRFSLKDDMLPSDLVDVILLIITVTGSARSMVAQHT